MPKGRYITINDKSDVIGILNEILTDEGDDPAGEQFGCQVELDSRNSDHLGFVWKSQIE